MKAIQISHIAKVLLNLLIVISFSMIVFSVYNHWKIQKDTIEKTKNNVDKQANTVVSDLDAHLSKVMQTAQFLVDGLNNGTIAYNDAEQATLTLLEEKKQQKIRFFGLQVAFNKGAYDPTQPEQLKNWVYFFDKKTSQIKSTQANYDYTLKDNSEESSMWYTQAVETSKAFWHEPRVIKVSGELVVGYSIPFFDVHDKEKVMGVVNINLSVEDFKSILFAQDYRKLGFSLILSKSGNVIYYPDRYTLLLDAAQKSDDNTPIITWLKELQKQPNRDNFNSYLIPNINKKAWIISKSMTLTDWNVQIVAFEEELKIQQQAIATDLDIVISGVCFFIFLLTRYLLNHYHSPKALWFASSFLGVIFCIGIGVLWYLANVKDLELGNGIQPLKTNNDIQAYEKEINGFTETIHSKKSFFIPTGVFIKSAKFNDSNDIDVSGYVWQRYELTEAQSADMTLEAFCNTYSPNLPQGKGVVLLEAEEEKIDLSCKDATYSSVGSGAFTLGWYFKVGLREPFDYSNYPLDKNSIWLRLRANSFNERITLIPDLRSYPFSFERALGGIDDKNFVLPSWQVMGTFFTTQPILMSANLGINGYVGQRSHDLLFNIMIERDFLDAFISTIIPICIIYLILFVTLFSSLQDILAVLGINAGLLFSVALWHSGLRVSLASSGITYFETFYFICYLVISLICINSVLLNSESELPLLRYQNNLIPKLIFLPLVFGLTFVITLIILF